MASNHLTNRRDLVLRFAGERRNLFGISGGATEVDVVDFVEFDGGSAGTFKFSECCYHPTANDNILSLGRLTEKGFTTDSTFSTLYVPGGGSIPIEKKGNLHRVTLTTMWQSGEEALWCRFQEPETEVVETSSMEDHLRLNHSTPVKDCD